MEKKKLGNIVILVVAVFFILPILAGRCGRKNDYGKGSGGEYTYKEQGLDKIIKQYRDEKNYTVILYDMDYVDKQYKHQYQVLLTNTDSTLNEEISEWLPVTEEFFIQNQDNLGMELASKTDGRLQKEVAPAGYSQYVGNPQYGRWVQRDGGSFWEFYGKYAMMSSIFHMVTRPARYSYYDDYYRNYRGSYRTYRGPSGYYGTTGYSKTKKGS
ncbi:MAG: hypothetical protein MI922_26710, partial [Bacteroidales bacterium]|nr:hypothetical protein [Bacteroidales bacterium]